MNDDTTVPEALAQRVAQLHRMLREATGTSGPQSLARLGVLATLSARGPCGITQLADAERISQPAMTTLVGRLERDGLVARQSCPDDRRAVRITLTPQGQAELADIRRARGRALAALLDHLDDADRAALEAALPALDRLVAADSPKNPEEQL